MNARLDDATSTTDPVVRGILGVTLAITLVGMLALVRAAVGGGGVDHVTVRINNRAAWSSRSMQWTPRATGSGWVRPGLGP